MGVLLFVFSFAILSLSISAPLQFVALGVLSLLIFLLTFLLGLKRQDKKAHFYPIAFNQMGHICEVNLFDAKGNVLLSTKGAGYLNCMDFARKLFQRIHPSESSLKLQEAIEDQTPCEVLVSGGGDGLGQQEKWWFIRVLPQQRFLSVSIADVSQPLGNFNQLQKSYNALEKFIDGAPFGIYYTSRSGHFIGVNGTLANWFGQLKEHIIGKRVSDLIVQGEDHFIMLRSDPPLKLYHLFSGTANLVFKMQSQELMGEVMDSFDCAPLPSIKINRLGHIIAINKAFRQMLMDYLDMSYVTALGDIVAEAQRGEVLKRVQRLFEATHGNHPFEVRFGDDKIYTTAYFSKLDKDVVLLQFIDISEQKRLEQQFIQSQKMQAVGQLAGGIAHDFNNLLTAMLGFCDLLLQRYIPSDPSYNDVMHIKQNATRAANLVRQLLAFSRQQTLQPKVLHITENLAELTALMRRLIGAGIELQVIHGRELWPIKVDASQLEQVIINLVVNARDAMGAEGKLTIRTSNYHNSKVTRLGHDMMPKGDYVLVEVQDTGHGIPPEYMERIFEPFFSTKEVGAGTGLGLSTVYGIVKQTGGFITVASTTKKPSGTTFKIFLPRFQGEETQERPAQETPPSDLTGGGRILLVEDEDAVRLFSARALHEKGYIITEASSGDDALELFKKGETFDLLITDVVMPKMDGPTLSKKIRDYQTNIKTIFISGYTEDTFRKNLDHNAKIHFLAKPFSLKELAAKVKDVLNA